jgi:8-oxo-dGTP pyrophosphatase MutT (NUDIX family)
VRNWRASGTVTKSDVALKLTLTRAQRGRLQRCLDEAIQPVPRGWHRFSVNGQGIGWLNSYRAALAQTALQNAGAHVRRSPGAWDADDTLDWSTAPADSTARSQVLARVAQSLRQIGELHGWRDELYALPLYALPDDSATSRVDTFQAPELFRLERAAFRFFGLRSRAAHVNGFTPDGRLWIGRRAPTKAVDPGLLDNVAAGGLPAGEDLHRCAIRELWEEAGIAADIAARLKLVGTVTTHRAVSDGLHHEDLAVFNLCIPDGSVPRNQDGEVSGFECLTLTEVIERIDSGQMTVDAAAVTAWGVLRQGV